MTSQAFAAPQALSSARRTRLAALTSERPLRIAIPKTRTARPPLTARVKDQTRLEDTLLTSIESLRKAVPAEGSLHVFRARAPEQFEGAARAVVELERSVSGFGAAVKRLKTLLPGTWQLVLTDSKAVEKNAGSITGLGSLPGAKCVRVDVELGKDGSARTVERVKVFGGLLEGENTLEGKWQVAEGNLEVTYAKAVLMGKAKLRADSKAVLRTSYCSSRVRIGRSGGGEFYIFVKQ